MTLKESLEFGWRVITLQCMHVDLQLQGMCNSKSSNWAPVDLYAKLAEQISPNFMTCSTTPVNCIHFHR